MSDAEQQVLALPRTDDRLVVEQLAFLDGVEDLEKVFAQQLADGLAVREAVKRGFQRAREGAGTVIGAAGDALGRLHPVYHADVTTDERGGDGEIGVAVCPRQAVFDAAVLRVGNRHAQPA